MRHGDQLLSATPRRSRAVSRAATDRTGFRRNGSRTAADEALADRIHVVHNADNTYGAPRITAELNDGVPDTERVNHKRVARVMRSAEIAGYRRKRRVKTTPAGSGQSEDA